MMEDENWVRAAFTEHVRMGMSNHRNMPKWLTKFADDINSEFPGSEASCWISSNFERVALVFKGNVVPINIKELNL